MRGGVWPLPDRCVGYVMGATGPRERGILHQRRLVGYPASWVLLTPMGASYTIVNLAEVENMAEGHGHGETMEARFPSGALGLTDSGISVQKVKPGKRQPFGHRHNAQEELYVVLSGSGRINLDGEVLDVRALDAIRIAPEVARCLEADDDGVEVLIFGAPRLENPMEDVEMLPGWWG